MIYFCVSNLRKQSFLLAHRRWGTFGQEKQRFSSRNVLSGEERLRSSQATVLGPSCRFIKINK